MLVLIRFSYMCFNYRISHSSTTRRYTISKEVGKQWCYMISTSSRGILNLWISHLENGYHWRGKGYTIQPVKIK